MSVDERGPKGGAPEIFGQRLRVASVGLSLFAEGLRSQGVDTVEVDFRPPPVEVSRLHRTADGHDVERANDEAVGRIVSGQALLKGLGVARELIPALQGKKLLHAGPPIAWERTCGPVRGAFIGACLYEGWADTPEAATKLLASGEVTIEPCHHHHAVGPMAGVVSPSMPMWIVENPRFGNRAFATLNEGLGKVLRFGAFSDAVLERLRWMAATLYPTLDRAVRAAAKAAPEGGIDVKSLISQALAMGDECHNRNKAGTSLLLRALGPSLARTSGDPEALARVLSFIDSNDHFFLNLSMATGKALTEPAEGIAGSTVVTTMARNGTDFGLRVAGLPGRWFTTTAGRVEGLYFPGFSEADANLDLGDSTITETAGFGGMAMACAPAIVQFVGGVPADALAATLEMYEICAAEHETFRVPPLGFRGTPVGIDVRRVVETGITPRLNTGIAHREPGVGQIGAGLLRAPFAAFLAAFEALRPPVR